MTVGPAPNFYLASVTDAPGLVANNNLLSVFNPSGSGKTLVFYNGIILPWATSGTSVAVSLKVYRTTAASGGTLMAAANVGKFVTSQPNSIAEVRTGNPTVTTSGLETQGIPPALTGAGAGVGAQGGGQSPPGASFVCPPGNGLVMQVPSGSTAQLWNCTFIWTEG
jgi:hypothetical protein